MDKRKAAFRAMGDSFFRQTLDDSLTSAQRADYAVDAVQMYAISIMQKTTAGKELVPADVLLAAARTLGLPLDMVMPIITHSVERRQGQRVDLRLKRLI